MVTFELDCDPMPYGTLGVLHGAGLIGLRGGSPLDVYLFCGPSLTWIYTYSVLGWSTP